MQALGRYAEARSAYELASWLDRDAAYPLNNLCYLSFLTGRADDAISSCQAALRLDPSFAAARNNLALAYAASGRMDLARAQFFDTEDRASALYNSGIAYLASGQDSEALAAFDAASKARPTFNISRDRARLIRERRQLAAFTGQRSGTPGQ